MKILRPSRTDILCQVQILIQLLKHHLKFVLTRTLKFNNGESFSRTYNGYDSFLNEFLTPALKTMPKGLIFNFEKIIANDIGAAVIWNGESEGLYDTYNNQYVYI